MSIKAATFASIITNPMPSHMFEVSIPEINFTAVVESTEFPAQGAVREIPLYFQGEKINYPGLPENGGTWAFKIPDSDTGVIKKEFDGLAAKFYNQKTGVATPQTWKDIKISVKNLKDELVFDCTLHGAWLKQRGNVSLAQNAADTPIKWDYTFVYNWFEDGKIGE